MSRSHSITSFIATLPDSYHKKYDYTLSEYTHSKTPMKIICRVHGTEFAAAPNNHQRGKGGCPLCKSEAISDRNRTGRTKPILSAAAIEARITSKFGSMFTYDIATFHGVDKPMTFTCATHSDFTTTPYLLLKSNYGCPKCGNANKSKQKNATARTSFVSKAHNVHGNAYTYPAIDDEYRTQHSIITVVCPKHGDFRQKAVTHLQGCGCPACAARKQQSANADNIVTWDAFIARAEARFGSAFQYRCEHWNGIKSRIEMYCDTHGWQHVIAEQHLQSMGCPVCNRRGGTTKTVAYLQQFIEAHGFAVVLEHSPEWLGRKSLDLFVPEAKLAIEFNGAWCHHSSPNSVSSTAKFARNRNAHHEKWKLCRDNGMTLLQIWDFKWDDRKHVYMSKILHYLGLDERVFARKCKLVEVTKTDVKHRYAEWSLEGGMQLPNAAQHYALEYNGQQVMWMTVGTKVREWGHQTELLRMVTLPGVTVVGGVSKMMSLCPKGTVMFTTNDSGSVLKDGTQSSLRYWWYNPQTRDVVTRAAASPAKRERLCGCKHGDGESEKAFMERHGWVQVWDSGLTKFVV